MKKHLLALGLTVLIFSSCKKENEEEQPIPATISIAEKKSVIANYSNIVYASYEDSYNKAIELQGKLIAFVANPSAAGLEECKTAWLASRIPYGQTEAYRFYGGPIDDEDGPEGLMNAWPMDESYVDYTSGNPNSGIINDPINFPTITIQTLIDANENGGETNVAAGYHAIEFLLWGQDLNSNGAGNRPYTDFVSDGTGTASNQVRRGQYLLACAELLVSNLNELKNEWSTSGAFRNELNNLMSADSALTKIIRGIGVLSKGELAGERMTVALTNQDQEDEHSCFSDNTHTDIQMNFVGIENVYLGRYTRVDGSIVQGASISSLVAKINNEKNNATLNQIADARSKIFSIPAPFDQQILGDPGNKVTDAINSLRDVSDRIADGVFEIGIFASF
jgi:putative iron-regulated protein